MNVAAAGIAVRGRTGECGLNCGVKRRLRMEAALSNGRNQVAAKTVTVVNQSKRSNGFPPKDVIFKEPVTIPHERYRFL